MNGRSRARHPEELEELPEDAIEILKSSPYASPPAERAAWAPAESAAFHSAPTNPRIPALAPAVVEDEIVELGQDAIVGEERGAHLPQPRTAVVQSQSSIVINARSPGDSPFSHGEKTVVVRDRRKLEQYAATAPQKQKASRGRERVLYFSAGIVAALLGTGLAAWLRSASDAGGEQVEVRVPVVGAPATTADSPSEGRAEPKAGPRRVSLEELPVNAEQR